MVFHVRRGKGGISRDIGVSPVLERLRVYFQSRNPTGWLFPSKQVCLRSPPQTK